MEARFRLLRPEVLEVLRKECPCYASTFSFSVTPGCNGFAENAFRLAEKYRDFRSLAQLCHKGTVYPPEQNPNADRIQSYLDRFKEEFSAELYRWYIEHGEYSQVLSHVSLLISIRCRRAQDDVHASA